MSFGAIVGVIFWALADRFCLAALRPFGLSPSITPKGVPAKP